MHTALDHVYESRVDQTPRRARRPWVGRVGVAHERRSWWFPNTFEPAAPHRGVV
jgi:hypothetical protein